MDLVKLIDDALVSRDEPPRNYIGASSIGHRCERKIWYDLHQKKEISPRLQRIFDIGHALEEVMKQWLDEAGLLVKDSGYRYVCKEFPHLSGHIDCLIEVDGETYVCDIKTCKHSVFRQVVKNGVKKEFETYYAQLQCYMGMSELSHAVLFVLDKDNADLFAEVVTFDPVYYEGLIYKAKKIWSTPAIPPKINKSPMFFVCQMCSHKMVCHSGD